MSICNLIMGFMIGQGYWHDNCAINKCYPHDGRADYQY